MSKRVAEFDHFFGMKRARSLQSLARELKETTDINAQDPFVYEGKIVTTPALFALATEIALKALYCQERELPSKVDKTQKTWGAWFIEKSAPVNSPLGIDYLV